ncbi:anaerobic ribonucleoside-triphosphate reductase [bacterium]|nr:anaerobic ribonucleoside-triphosphate reductase [bacterium]MCK4326749.1 anaerobic ribonucleoside-triphosphate reductase [bacterium]
MGDTLATKEKNEVKTFTSVRKRDGRIVLFNETKIADAIFKAARAVGGEDKFLAEDLAKAVTFFLKKKLWENIPDIEDIQDSVEKVLIETGHARTAKAYILYRDQRARQRERLKVRKEVRDKRTTTDLSLLVTGSTRDESIPWEKTKISEALVKEANLSPSVADSIATSVEGRVISSGLNQISTTLVRELVDNELFSRGYRQKLLRQKLIGMPSYDLDQLIFSKSNENSNITSNNPEAINLAVAENTIKQYMLQRVFSPEVANAHLTGMIHIHDLGYPRVYCSSHSLEYLKKYGLELGNLDTCSAPAAHARTLTGHLNTFLASLQAYYAGALGVGYINIFYAPYLIEMSDEEMRQEAQYLIFSGSQNAFSRGGQTLFLDFNVHLGIPTYLREVPAIGPRGKYTGKSYGEYEEEARRFTRAMLDVWRAGDRYGNVFAFPKCDLHVSQEAFDDPLQYELLEYACQIASENGTPYFVFDRDEVTLSACCRLRTRIRDNYMIEHPESMRFCGFQNVTINLPQAAYRAGKGNVDKIYEEIARAMDIAMKAHLEKKKFIAQMMSAPNMPMWEVGKLAKDGRPYIDLDKSTYIIGIIGLNECVQHLTGKELHEDDEAYKLGVRIISFMNLKAKEYEEKHNLQVALEESPAESATKRLSKVDLREYPEASNVVKGDIDNDENYYTNSIHFRADAGISLVERIEKQSRFHTLIESGAILHAFVGEQKPPASGILNLVRKTWENTQAAQLAISPEFTVCDDCHRNSRGLMDTCQYCDSKNVHGITRIVGYFSRVNNWNLSKIGELKDRHKGDYGIH